MKQKTKAGISFLIILVCLGYLGYQFREKLHLQEWLDKVPFLVTEEDQEEALESIKWLTFVHGTLHYSMKYPDTYLLEKQEDGNVIHFNNHGKPAVKVRSVTVRERAEKGLWLTNNPVEMATMAGQTCKKYTSREIDGSEIVEVLSYVINAEGRLFAVEFPTKNGSLSPTQEVVLGSFQMDEEIAASPPH